MNTRTDPATAGDLQHRMNTYWSRWAAEYDAQQARGPRRAGVQEVWEQVWRQALSVVSGGGPHDVLDVGTGSGNVAMAVARLGHRVTGIDLAEGMLETARAKLVEERPGERAGDGDVRFLLGDAVAPSFPACSFDAIVSRYVLWTLRDAAAALSAWHRLLRPGGVVAAVDSAWFPEDTEVGDGLDGARRDDFIAAYGSGALAELSLASGRQAEVVEALRAAGFDEVSSYPLVDVLDLDRREGVAPGHRPQLQVCYLARKAVAAR